MRNGRDRRDAEGHAIMSPMHRDRARLAMPKDRGQDRLAGRRSEAAGLVGSTAALGAIRPPLGHVCASGGRIPWPAARGR